MAGNGPTLHGPMTGIMHIDQSGVDGACLA